MSSLEAIKIALSRTESKISNLRKAYEDLKSHSSLLSSFDLTWPQIESHFMSIQTQLLQKFYHLQSQIQTHNSQIKSFCENKDGLGLINHLASHKKEKFWFEIHDSMRFCPDPASMILDAMEGYYSENYSKGLASVRKNCVYLLEELIDLKPEISSEVKERAISMAKEWKGKVSFVGGNNAQEVLGFVHLLAAFDLGTEFDYESLFRFLIIVSHYRPAVKLCQVLLSEDKIPSLVQELISKGKQILAVKFIFAFGLTDKFPPMPLLIAYVTESNRIANVARETAKGSINALNSADANEINALRQVVKYIKEHDLESEYPKGPHEKRIEDLLEEKERRKRLLADKHKQKVTKCPRISPKIGVDANSTVTPIHKSNMQSVDLLNLNSSYTSSYGSVSATANLPRNLNPIGSQVYYLGS